MSNINNNNKNSGENRNSPQRTSPRFSNNNVAPQYHGDNYHSSGLNTSTTSSANSSNNVSPTRTRKRNSSSRIEEQQATNESSLNPHNHNVQFYLEKLELLYQNLEGRVQKLENIVADQFLITTSNPPYAVVARNPQAGFNMSDFSIASNSTSTSHSSLIPTAASTIPTTSSTSTICSLLEPIQKEISKSDLDDYCLPVLQRRATPSIGELNAIVMNLKKLKYPDIDNKFILSKVREWFRRKREYMSQRIFNICSKKFGHLANDTMALSDLCQKARNNPIFVGEMVREANLEILNEASAWEFCSEKITSYLENLLSNNSGGSFQSQF